MAEIYFPIKGLHKGIRPGAQPEGTSPDLNNVRPYDVLGNRLPDIKYLSSYSSE